MIATVQLVALKMRKVASLGFTGLIVAVWKRPRVDCVQSKIRVSGEKDAEGGRKASSRAKCFNPPQEA